LKRVFCSTVGCCCCCALYIRPMHIFQLVFGSTPPCLRPWNSPSSCCPPPPQHPSWAQLEGGRQTARSAHSCKNLTHSLYHRTGALGTLFRETTFNYSLNILTKEGVYLLWEVSENSIEYLVEDIEHTFLGHLINKVSSLKR